MGKIQFTLFISNDLVQFVEKKVSGETYSWGKYWDQDYIFNHQTSEDIIQENARKQQKTDSLDTLYNELQIPILISVLYFIFQLPIFHKTLFRYLPSLFNSDGNHNLAGFIFNSTVFGGIYYLMTKSIQNLGI